MWQQDVARNLIHNDFLPNKTNTIESWTLTICVLVLTFYSFKHPTIFIVGKESEQHSAMKSKDNSLYLHCFVVLEECTLADWIVKIDKT